MQEIHTPLDRFAGIFPRTPLCQVVISLSWVLITLLSLMLSSLPLIISHIARACLMSSQAEPLLYILCILIPHFSLGGDIPPSVTIPHMFPCIEHRYVSLLATSLFSPWHSSLPRLVTIKNFYYFSIFSKYLKKSPKKNKKPKSQIGKDVMFGSIWVLSPSNRALCITSIGWFNILTLGAVLISLSLSPPTR